MSNVKKDDLIIQAFHALAGLAKHGKIILKRIKFINLAVKILEFHRESVDIVSAGWHCLGSMANNGVDFLSSKNKLLTLILESMRKFKRNHGFQITACFALAHLFFNTSKLID